MGATVSEIAGGSLGKRCAYGPKGLVKIYWHFCVLLHVKLTKDDVTALKTFKWFPEAWHRLVTGFRRQFFQLVSVARWQAYQLKELTTTAC